MLGIAHEVVPADVEERPEAGEDAEAMAVRLAGAKARSVWEAQPERPVLAADTVVVVDGQLLGKPADADEAARMLERLSGREHTVVTAVALIDRGGRAATRCDVTQVRFRPLTAEMIRDYVATGEPLDKAGAYGVQGKGALLVERVEGDFFGVMGLPLRLVAELLEDAGIAYRFTR
jgi:septum formation protein